MFEYSEIERKLPSMDRDVALEIANDLVELAVDAAYDAGEIWKQTHDPEAAYDLLAGWMKINRIKSEWLQQIDRDEDIRNISMLVQADAAELCCAAQSIPDPQSWLSNMRYQAEQYLIGAPEMRELPDAAMTFRIALTELDDAELVVAAMNNLGFPPDQSLDSDLSECLEWMAENADVFLSAAAFIQCSFMIFRTEQDGLDPESALTIRKFQMLLIEMVEMVSELEQAEPMPVSAEQIAEAIGLMDKPGIREIPEKIAELIRKIPEAVRKYVFVPVTIPEYRPVFARAASPPDDIGHLYVWNSFRKGERWNAALRIPPSAEASDTTQVRLFLTGMPEAQAVYFNGIYRELTAPETSDNVRTAEFSLGELRAVKWNSTIPTLAVIDRRGNLTIGVAEP